MPAPLATLVWKCAAEQQSVCRSTSESTKSTFTIFGSSFLFFSFCQIQLRFAFNKRTNTLYPFGPFLKLNFSSVHIQYSLSSTRRQRTDWRQNCWRLLLLYLWHTNTSLMRIWFLFKLWHYDIINGKDLWQKQNRCFLLNAFVRKTFNNLNENTNEQLFFLDNFLWKHSFLHNYKLLNANEFYRLISSKG